MRTTDLRIYALVDPARAGGHSLPELARALVDGGATLLQLRDKNGTTRQQIEEVRAIKQAIAGSTVPLLINDRVDVALAADADGVHVGWDDMAVEDARRLLGPDAIIGLSIKTSDHVARAPLALLNYVCIGGVFATSSKDNPDSPIGTEGLRKLVGEVRARAPKLPVGAIAGIEASNAADVVRAGVEGVAVISALSLAPDPAAATCELRRIIDATLQEVRS